MPRYILLHETASTNTYLKSVASTLPSGTVVYTHNQTAGRGQRGNSWEAEPGKNITMSMLIKNPAVPVAQQFYISEAVAVAIARVLNRYVPGFQVKWPNDIYHRDRKECGILIEHMLAGGGIAHTVIGAGININQTEFLSDAPNPMSLAQLTGEQHDVEAVMHEVCEEIEHLCQFTPQSCQQLHEEFLSMLYRGDGKDYTFALPDGTQFQAAIHNVLPDGTLQLRTPSGTVTSYLFKEVKHVIGNNTL